MTIRKLPTMQEKTDAPPTKKPPRNRTELSATNGFEFGLGFWLDGVLVMFFGVPALTCVTIIVIGALGQGRN